MATAFSVSATTFSVSPRPSSADHTKSPVASRASSLKSSLTGTRVQLSAAPRASHTVRRASLMATEASAATFAGKTFYDFEVENIKGEKIPLSEYKGKVALVVNVASACGLTDSNYKGLQQVYDKYKSQGFVVLAFPSNQFGAQEPGSNKEIENFACSRYRATFPLFSKVDVNGPNTVPVYQYLKSQKGGGILGNDIKWNFGKFLVDKQGNVVGRYAPTTSPADIENDIKKLL